MEHSTNYVILFVVAMTSLVAVTLTTLREVTKTQSELNEAIFNKRQTLKAIASHLGDNSDVEGMDDADVLKIFDGIKQIALNKEGIIQTKEDIINSGYKRGLPEHIDMAKEKKKPVDEQIFPLYVYNNGKQDFYIMSVRGSGLWDEIWGCVAIEGDMKTVAGASFDHKGETPGLGAEIKDNPAFAKQFKGKTIYNTKGEYTSVFVRKGGARDKTFEVDGISGATVTADGVGDMLYAGIQRYEKYFDTLKK